MTEIIPAILTNDIKDLENKLKEVRGLAEWAQIDIADGQFVNNNSVKLKELENADSLKDFFIEAHLMVFNPENYFSDCQSLEFKRVVFHAEAVDDINKTIEEAKKYGFKVGLAINPETTVVKIHPYLGKIDCVLVMSVFPGFQGQKFIADVLKKVKELKTFAPNLLVGIDGGINVENIKQAADSGADYLVVGSGLFGGGSVKVDLLELQSKI